jgi:hypothetical protein
MNRKMTLTMRSKIYHQLIAFGLLWLLIGVYPVWGVETGYTNGWDASLYPSHLSPGTPSTLKLRISCVNAYTGEFLDCPFTYKVLGLKPLSESSDNNGGHMHNYDTHTLIDPPDGALQFDGADSDPGQLGIKGQTQNTRVLVIHPMPRVAGKIQVETIITAPPGDWRCGYACWTETSWRYLGAIDVGIQGWAQLPDSGDHHVVVRGGTDTHPEGTYGTSDTIEILRKIAKEYFKSTGRRMSINDLSLPKGGLFDINSDYTTPHIEHRTATDADLNRCDEGGQFCPTCKFLREVVRAVAKGQLRPSLKCESAGRKHIDFN